MQKTKGQLEDTIVKRVTEFYAQKLGVGPENARAYIVEDMVIVRLQGKLLPIEAQLLDSHEGVDLVKKIRERLDEAHSNELKSIIANITGYQVTSVHADNSTKTGERFVTFMLDKNLAKELERVK